VSGRIFGKVIDAVIDRQSPPDGTPGDAHKNPPVLENHERVFFPQSLARGAAVAPRFA
jgi:hypothetical protein